MIENLGMSARQQILSHAMDPNLALVLGVIGLLGLYVEMSHPGMILPGVVGALCTILSLYAFNRMPLNWAGAALILLAIVLFVLEATIATHGILGLGGIVSMIEGLLMLVEGPIPQMRIHPATAIAVTLPLAGIMIFIIRLAVAARRKKSIQPVALQRRYLQTLTGIDILDYFTKARGKE